MFNLDILNYTPVELANIFFDEKKWFKYDKDLIQRYAIFLLTLDDKDLNYYLEWALTYEAYEICSYIKHYLEVIEENNHLFDEFNY